MNVIEALNSRYSCRAFKPEKISRETIVKIIEAATRTPSWANTQPWEIYIAGGAPLEKLRQEFLARLRKGIPRNPDITPPQQWPPDLQARRDAAVTGRYEVMGIKRDDKVARQGVTEANYTFFGAPIVVYICMERNLTTWSIFDNGMLTQSIMLAAQEFGVDSMPAVALVAYPELIRAELGIPDNLLILFGLALGHTDAKHIMNRYHSSRRPINEVIKFKGI